MCAFNTFIVCSASACDGGGPGAAAAQNVMPGSKDGGSDGAKVKPGAADGNLNIKLFGGLEVRDKNDYAADLNAKLTAIQRALEADERMSQARSKSGGRAAVRAGAPPTVGGTDGPV